MPKLTFWRLPVALLAVLTVLILAAARIAAASADVEAERDRAADTAGLVRCGGERG